MRFLLIDDHPLMRSSLRQVLLHTFRGCTVEEACNAQEAMGQLPRQPWELVILDIDLPDRSGVDLLRDVRNLAPTSPVLVMSGMAEEEFGRRVLKAGASGFISKASPADEIVAAIRRVASGKTYVTSDLAVSMVGDSLKHGEGEPHDSLSAREFEVLRLFGAGHGASEIAGKLGVSVKTVSTYRSRILEKLRLKSTAEVIRYAVIHKLV